MLKTRLLVLFGGVSTEHEVSLVSAASVLKNINSEKYEIIPVGITKEGKWYLFTGSDYNMIKDNAWQRNELNIPVTLSVNHGEGLILFKSGGETERCGVDCAFPVLHGANGEDGTMQGLFEICGIPYVGPGVAASANSMDKAITKVIISGTSVRQAGYEIIYKNDFLRSEEKTADRVEARFKEYPLFVKPSSSGSSVGVSKAKNRVDLIGGISDAVKYCDKVLVEEYIEGRELEVSVLGNLNPSASVVGEIVPGKEFYSYEAKYKDDTSRLFIPAKIPEETSETIRDWAVKVYLALGCKGLSRVDFFLRNSDGKAFFNEINTIPGFTDISMYPKLFEASGIPYSQLIDNLIELALAAKTR